MKSLLSKLCAQRICASLLVLASAACAGGGDSANPAGAGGAGGAAAGSGASDAGSALPELNGCSTELYVDRSADSDERVIAIAAMGLTYSPKCLRIAVGQTVRWSGSLTAHPLAPGNPQDAKAGSPDNPVQPTASGQSVEFAFPNAGTYPYFCTLHGFGTGQGMAGSVRVE
jgi:plastocyanin